MALHLALYCFSTPTSIPSKRAPISSLPPYPQYQNWRPYAIYRLEHWGLQYVNNAEVTDDEILAANGAYGGLKNGQWTGMIRELRTQMADLAVIDMSITSIRQTAVDITMPYMNTGQQKTGDGL